MATIASEFRDLILEFAQRNGRFISNPLTTLNEYKVDTKDFPIFTGTNDSFMNAVKPYADAAAAGRPVGDRVSADVVLAYARAYANAAAAIVRAQDRALAEGRYHIPAMSYYFSGSMLESFQLLKEVVNNDERTRENVLAAYRPEIRAAIKTFVDKAKEDAKNIDKAQALAREAANKPRPPSSSGQPAPVVEAVVPPSDDAKLVEQVTTGSPAGGIGGKIAIAAAVVVGGFILWKFFTRNR